MPSKIVLAPAMHCEHCKAKIEENIKQLHGVDVVLADEKKKTVAVMWSEPQNWETIAALLTEIGYPPQPLNEIKRHVAIVLYDGFTALDAVGPYEVLVSLPDTQVHFVSNQRGPVWADTGQLALTATATFDEIPNPAVIVIPGGGHGIMKAVEDPALMGWIKQAHETSEWTTSVCTGVYVLGLAGILQGLDVTTHWGSRGFMQQYCGANYIPERFVQQGKVITAAGVSAGIDMALFLAEKLSNTQTAQAIQLACEYDPHPPFAAGNFQTVSPELIAEANQVVNLYRTNPA
ncbi:MAG: DJ-1/PfpI family protein [Anaerolineales bacterium]|nr:DJ-1/PfpI family protein [Anaerolineales bacterium]MBP6210860.1 DJ-1/PfpI family protein [Anaerolineales bacterium]